MYKKVARKYLEKKSSRILEILEKVRGYIESSRVPADKVFKYLVETKFNPVLMDYVVSHMEDKLPQMIYFSSEYPRNVFLTFLQKLDSYPLSNLEKMRKQIWSFWIAPFFKEKLERVSRVVEAASHYGWGESLYINFGRRGVRLSELDPLFKESSSYLLGFGVHSLNCTPSFENDLIVFTAYFFGDNPDEKVLVPFSFPDSLSGYYIELSKKLMNVLKPVFRL